jgi:hypothetical protein
MSFAAPAFLGAGIAAAIVVAALHFLARQRPRSAVFPTARFIPEKTARAPSRAVRPSDLLLLALRAAALILLGAAFAKPVWDRPRSGTARVVLLDRSRAVRSRAEGRDSALALLRDGDALVLLDRFAHLSAADSLHVSGQPVMTYSGSLSAAFVAAQKAAATIADRADSLELVIVSPLVREEWDAATAAIRAEWPGRVRIVRVTPAPPDTTRWSVSVRGGAGDPLVSAGLAKPESGASARVIRGTPTHADSVWAIYSSGVLVLWPSALDSSKDTVGALVMGDDVVVASFTRHALPSTDAQHPYRPSVARWSDGSSAASENPTAAGCIRDVAIPVPAVGDLVLREDFRRVFAGLTGPCGGARDFRPATDSGIAQLTGKGPLASARNWSRAGEETPPLARWLLVAAALLLVAEPLVRRRSA